MHSASARLTQSDCPRCARRGESVPLELTPFRLKRTAMAARAADATLAPESGAPGSAQVSTA
jgi:hypothetical protein